MTSEIIDTIEVCQDCLHAHANGEYSPDRPADLPEPLCLIVAPYSVTMGMRDDEHSEYCRRAEDGECDCEDRGFSTRRCEGCGDTHHGDRYAMTLWKD